MIEVGNHRHRPHQEPPGWTPVYVGRPAALGNPLIIGRDGTRADVVEGYRTWLKRMIEQQNLGVQFELSRIADIAKQSNVRLYCWCAPEACHADVIRETVQRYLDTGNWI